MKTKVRDKGVAQALNAEPAGELDDVLAERHEDVEALLDEARTAKAEGLFAPLEPLHDFLRRARARFRSQR
jgi:hypothetical protein